jgi:hypothetical protein
LYFENILFIFRLSSVSVGHHQRHQLTGEHGQMGNYTRHQQCHLSAEHAGQNSTDYTRYHLQRHQLTADHGHFVNYARQQQRHQQLTDRGHKTNYPSQRQTEDPPWDQEEQKGNNGDIVERKGDARKPSSSMPALHRHPSGQMYRPGLDLATWPSTYAHHYASMMMAPLPPHYQMASPRQSLAAEAAADKAASASQLTSSCPQGDRQETKGEDILVLLYILPHFIEHDLRQGLETVYHHFL